MAMNTNLTSSEMEQSARVRGKDTQFERVRRITGYLVGTMDKWNSGKRAEERDRVKHGATKLDELEAYESVGAFQVGMA